MWLASPLAEGITGQVLKVGVGVAQIIQGWRPVSEVPQDGLWTIEDLAASRGLLFGDRDTGVPPFLHQVQ